MTEMSKQSKLGPQQQQQLTNCELSNHNNTNNHLLLQQQHQQPESAENTEENTITITQQQLTNPITIKEEIVSHSDDLNNSRWQNSPKETNGISNSSNFSSSYDELLTNLTGESTSTSTSSPTTTMAVAVVNSNSLNVVSTINSNVNSNNIINSSSNSITLPESVGVTMILSSPLPASQLPSQQQQQQQQVNSSLTNAAATSLYNSHLTWEEAVSAPILPIRCKDTNAELYKNKFGSGNKGKCIKAANDWFTPTEFEALCGRGNSKDWKRSIRFGGRTLQTLIDKGFLVPHASSCICSNCVDDATATGPIRPFTPYQRKRKSQSGDALKGSKLERLTSKDSNTDESSDIGTPGTPGACINPLTQALMKFNQMTLPSCTEDAWKVIEDGVERIATASTTLKALVQEMKERTNQEAEELRSQLQNSLQTAVVQNPVVGHPQILRIFDNNRIQTYSIEVLDPESFKSMQTNSSPITKCDNCGREGSLECSGCHTVHYCSSFCQKKDWPAHQAACQAGGLQLKEEVL